MSVLPYFARGNIVRGFGRGSKELGFPTANFPDQIVDALPESFECGVYFGWANVDNGPVYKMLMSVGYNPFYNNAKRTMETHILHSYETPLYGLSLAVCVLGFIRPQKNFSGVEELIKAIKDDVAYAEGLLDLPENYKYVSASFFVTDSV